MKHKIPNTNLTLTEAEIKAVIDFAYSRSIDNNKSQKIDKKLSIVEEYKGEVLSFPDNSIFVNYVHNKMN